MLILGAKLIQMETGGFRPSKALTRRVDQAVAQAPEGAFFLVSGGARCNTPTEAQAAAELLRQQGIPDSRILQEHLAQNTFENLLFSRRLLPHFDTARIWLVTDGFHLPRARLIAWGLGIPVRPVAAAKPDLPRWKHLLAYLREGLSLPLSIWRLARHALTTHKETGGTHPPPNTR